jgi:hypothetical protein
MSYQISSYRLGDAYQSKLYDEDIEALLREHPNTIGSEYLLSEKKQESKCIDTITEIVQKYIEKNKHLLPKDIETSTVIHLRLGDVVEGNTWHERLKRPFDVDLYKSIIPNQKTYVIGKPFFANTSSTNYEESIQTSEKYLEKLINELGATHFDGGHADIDLCCAVACECFVQGKGFFSDLIIQIRKKLNLKNIETTFKQGMKFKKVALISTYCDTQEKLDVLSKNIDNVKTFGLDVVVISPLSLPEYIQKKCDYFLLMKDNPVLDWPQRAMFAWKDMNLNGQKIKITRTYADYGWAGLYQVKKLSEIALSLNYDYFYHMIYDLKFDETVVDGLLGESDCDVYSSKRGDIVWEVGLHFMIFNKENLKKFIQHITLKNYLASKGGDAFVWLHQLNEVFPYKIVKTPVEDEIYYYDGHDFFNSSPIDDLKIFIEKNDETDSTIKLLFYDVNQPKNIFLKIGKDEYGYQINVNSLIDLGFKKENIKNVSLVYNGVEYDITKKIEMVKHNTLQIMV